MRAPTHILSKILAGCCCIILVIMVFCVIWQVIARFIFNAPNAMLDEFTQILFMQMVLFGGVYTVGLKRHLAIDLLVQKFPAASVLALNSFIQIIITVFAVISVICGGNIVVEGA